MSSQVTHPKVTFPHRPQSLRTTVLAALLVLATAFCVAAVALTAGSDDRSAAAPAVLSSPQIERSGAAPLETRVAAAVGTRPAPSPDESAIAASIGSR